MDIPIIIGIIVLILAVVIILKVVKKLIKAISIIIGILLLLSTILTYLIYLDVNDINQNFGTQESMFVYQDQEKILTGIYGVFGEEQQPNYLAANQLDSFDKVSLKKDYFRIFIFRKEAFDSIQYIEDFDGKQVAKTDAIFLIESDDLMVDIEKTNLKDHEVGNIAEFKGMLFASLFNQALQEDNSFLFKQYKKGNVDIYPETIVFRIIKSVPDFFIDKIIKIQGE